MSTIPITGQWSLRRVGSIELDLPAVPLTAVYDNGGGHVTITLTRYQANQARAILHLLFTISATASRRDPPAELTAQSQRSPASGREPLAGDADRAVRPPR